MRSKTRRIIATVALWAFVLAAIGGTAWLFGTIHLTAGWMVVAKFFGGLLTASIAYCCGEYAITEVFSKKEEKNEKSIF